MVTWLLQGACVYGTHKGCKSYRYGYVASGICSSRVEVVVSRLCQQISRVHLHVNHCGKRQVLMWSARRGGSVAGVLLSTEPALMGAYIGYHYCGKLVGSHVLCYLSECFAASTWYWGWHAADKTQHYTQEGSNDVANIRKLMPA